MKLGQKCLRRHKPHGESREGTIVFHRDFFLVCLGETTWRVESKSAECQRCMRKSALSMLHNTTLRCGDTSTVSGEFICSHLHPPQEWPWSPYDYFRGHTSLYCDNRRFSVSGVLFSLYYSVDPHPKSYGWYDQETKI